MAAKHQIDLILCRKQPGIGDGRCPICDSFVRPHAQVRVCDECNYGSFANRCCVCGLAGVADAYYCKECVQQEKDRDGCPYVINIGQARSDWYYDKKKYGFQAR